MTKLSKSLLNNDLDNFSLCFILQKNLVKKVLGLFLYLLVIYKKLKEYIILNQRLFYYV